MDHELGRHQRSFHGGWPYPATVPSVYAHQPAGGIPGVSPSDVIEVVGNLYGSNDAPFQWFQTLDQEAKAAGFEQSTFDKCLYFFRDRGTLAGVLGAHVDDTITGDTGEAYAQAISKLKSRFPYRKWRVGSGEFCGVMYTQTLEISYQQSEYARHLRPISMTKEKRQDREASATDREINALRALNGAANWLSGQTRPDLAVQTSFSQQCFPEPKVQDLLHANQLVHRARQHSDVHITVRQIPLPELGIAFHSDAGFANAVANRTQAGYILAFVNKALDNDEESAWTPFCWKSYKMPRVVASTLAGEAQAFASASGIAEWVSLMLVEAQQGCMDLREAHSVLENIPLVGITDCKSLYDAIHCMSSPSKVEDKRVAIDLAIIRQAVKRTGMKVRWCPTELMLAASPTKDSADPADLLRAALQCGEYQLAPEASVLAQKKLQREARARRQQIQQAPAAESLHDP